MSANIVNRIYLPDGRKVYVSDDKQVAELYALYGDLPLEACEKDSSKSLDELQPLWRGTIEGANS